MKLSDYQPLEAADSNCDVAVSSSGSDDERSYGIGSDRQSLSYYLGLPYQDHNYGAPPPSNVVSQVSPVKASLQGKSQSKAVPKSTKTSFCVSNGRQRHSNGVQSHSSNNDNEVKDEEPTICICGFSHDDGYMICCDSCHSWQHIECMRVSKNAIPKYYRCGVCDPRPLNKQRAISLQRRKEKLIFSEDDESTDTDGSLVTSKKASPKQCKAASQRNQRKPSKSSPKCSASPIVGDPASFKLLPSNTYSSDVLQVVSQLESTNEYGTPENVADRLRESAWTVKQTSPTGLIATDKIMRNCLIGEYKGHVLLKDKCDMARQILRHTCPYVLFHSTYDIAVDARQRGSDERFVRRSCKPNSTIASAVVKGKLRFFLTSSHAIQPGEEITIPFDYSYRQCNYTVKCACDANNQSCPVFRYSKRKPKLILKTPEALAIRTPTDCGPSRLVDPETHHLTADMHPEKLSREDKKLQYILKQFEMIERKKPLDEKDKKFPEKERKPQPSPVKSEPVDIEETVPDDMFSVDMTPNVKKALVVAKKRKSCEARVTRATSDKRKEMELDDDAGEESIPTPGNFTFSRKIFLDEWQRLSPAEPLSVKEEMPMRVDTSSLTGGFHSHKQPTQVTESVETPAQHTKKMWLHRAHDDQSRSLLAPPSPLKKRLFCSASMCKTADLTSSPEKKQWGMDMPCTPPMKPRFHLLHRISLDESRFSNLDHLPTGSQPDFAVNIPMSDSLTVSVSSSSVVSLHSPYARSLSDSYDAFTGAGAVESVTGYEPISSPETYKDDVATNADSGWPGGAAKHEIHTPVTPIKRGYPFIEDITPPSKLPKVSQVPVIFQTPISSPSEIDHFSVIPGIDCIRPGTPVQDELTGSPPLTEKDPQLSRLLLPSQLIPFNEEYVHIDNAEASLPTVVSADKLPGSPVHHFQSRLEKPPGNQSGLGTAASPVVPRLSLDRCVPGQPAAPGVPLPPGNGAPDSLHPTSCDPGQDAGDAGSEEYMSALGYYPHQLQVGCPTDTNLPDLDSKIHAHQSAPAKKKVSLSEYRKRAKPDDKTVSTNLIAVEPDAVIVTAAPTKTEKQKSGRVGSGRKHDVIQLTHRTDRRTLNHVESHSRRHRHQTHRDSRHVHRQDNKGPLGDSSSNKESRQKRPKVVVPFLKNRVKEKLPSLPVLPVFDKRLKREGNDQHPRKLQNHENRHAKDDVRKRGRWGTMKEKDRRKARNSPPPPALRRHHDSSSPPPPPPPPPPPLPSCTKRSQMVHYGHYVPDNLFCQAPSTIVPSPGHVIFGYSPKSGKWTGSNK